MKKLCKPTFEKKDHGQGAGIPVLKTIWDLFDLLCCFPSPEYANTPEFQRGSWLLPTSAALLIIQVLQIKMLSFQRKLHFYNNCFPGKSSLKVPSAGFSPSPFSGSGSLWADLPGYKKTRIAG
ncbi:hypothetical protein BR63_03660 [Thermanaerosceptrum fracticalcis]|nr:hypothetical protein [Thermanaerosceptrum fracticalcis]QNB45493.1 hypothetical protein BR63_03660 [Thermanaerosceptrum fracticalcis]